MKEIIEIQEQIFKRVIVGKEVYGRIKLGKYNFLEDFKPWDTDSKVKFVEAFMCNMITPQIYLDETVVKGEYNIIAGAKEMDAIYSFICGEFALEENSLKLAKEILKNKRYVDFTLDEDEDEDGYLKESILGRLVEIFILPNSMPSDLNINFVNYALPLTRDVEEK